MNKLPLSTADTDVQESWVEDGKLHAMVSLAEGEPFKFSYSPSTLRHEFDNEAIGDFDPEHVIGEVMGVLADFYDLETLEDNVLYTARENGFVEISSGVYLNSRDYVIAEQDGWADEDECKNFDFTAAPYWLTTNDGQEPVPVYNENDSDLVEAMDNA